MAGDGEEVRPAAIPLADHSANIVLVVDATDANLSELPAAELGRVTAPYRGEVVVGKPEGGPGGLTQAALTALAKNFGGGAKVKSDGIAALQLIHANHGPQART